MSLRRDNFTKKDKYFMNIAINLAYSHKGYTGSNPSVGCIVVKNNNIISYGVTSFFGRPHAEINALSKNNKIKNSTVYLTLEPCAHFGKTPPCTSALIKSKVKKVIYSLEDTDPRTANKSKKILSQKNIIVKSGLLQNKSKKLYKNYNYSKKINIPYLTAKLACSKKLKIFNDKSQISNIYSKQVTHVLRSQNQGILTTYKTINIDNPKLNCRIYGQEKFSPVRIIIDKDLRIKKNCYAISNSNPTIIFHSSKNKLKLNFLNSSGIKTYFINKDKDNLLNILDILKKVYQIGITSLLIESGPTFLKYMLKLDVINEFYLFKSNIKIPKTKTIDINHIIKLLLVCYKSPRKINTHLDKDLLLHYY